MIRSRNSILPGYAPASTLCAALLLLPTLAPGQTRLYAFESRYEKLCTHFGTAVASAGDLNRDGFADVIVGADMARNGNGAYAGAAIVYSGKDGRILFLLQGNKGSSFGHSVSGLGDVNRDGFPDLAVGAPTTNANGFLSGSVFVYSGKDASILHTFHGDATRHYFGRAVSGGGDFDRDGHADLIVGSDKNYVRIYSGKTGKMLREIRGVLGTGFGIRLAGAGDVNRDGWPDLVIGAPLTKSVARDSGSAYVYSGKDGRLLYAFHGRAEGEQFGRTVAGAGDVNRDGYADVIVGADYWYGNRRSHCGYARVLSGRNGNTLYLFISPCTKLDWFGWRVSGAGDTNGDGYADFLVAALDQVFLYSGKDGSKLAVYEDEPEGSFSFGWSVSGAGDVNGDGFADVVIGEYCGQKGRSVVHVFAGNHIALSADKSALSLAKSESLTFQLDARKVQRIKLYLLLGSLSGWHPGLQLGSVRLPLKADPYFLLSLASPNNVVLSRSLGLLDGNGRGFARLTLPPGLPPGLAGLTMHHAFVAIDLTLGSPDFASNPVATKIVR
ncbi:MAG: FG-GAP-like repeat-containing protein [Planctomycetota bacterium]